MTTTANPGIRSAGDAPVRPRWRRRARGRGRHGPAPRLARITLSLVLAIGAATISTDAAEAQIRRHPTGVNVNAQGATSVFITFGNLDGMVPVEATWCGELIPAAPDVGERCDPSTVFGNLPIRHDLARTSGDDALTDIMSIPPSVARRAYQAAERGANSAFFYVRRFVDPQGLRPDEYVTVTCRLTGGGARTPLSLLDVRLAFAVDEPVLSLDAGDEAPPLTAEIAHTGTGRLRGRWEVVLPGEESPTSEDLLTEASLPVELRGTQRRYTEVGRFDVFLPPTGEVTLEGPDPDALPTDAPGLYMVLLRIEATDDKEADSDLAAAGAGDGVVHSAAVAGFPIPPLRYYVGGGDAGGGGFRLLEPRGEYDAEAGVGLVFAWTETPGPVAYRVEARRAGEEVLSALVSPGVGSYTAPPWLAERLGGARFQWRVVALEAGGSSVAATSWRTVRAAEGGESGGDG